MNFVPITFIQSSLRSVLISNPIVANIQKIELKLFTQFTRPIVLSYALSYQETSPFLRLFPINRNYFFHDYTLQRSIDFCKNP